jgi:Holliday junction resolvase RusA-like endonuclease
MKIQLKFEIKPMAKQSFRTTRSGQKYLDPSVIKYRKAIRNMAIAQMRNQKAEKIEGAVNMNIVYAFRRPQSLSKKERNEIDGGKTVPKTTKPDIDNLTKAILDALNGIVWKDDAQVAQINIQKIWSAKDQIEIEIWKTK